MDLSIIIVNKDTSGLLTQCLNSIYSAGSRFSFEVIVVDNGSSDDSVSLVESNFPDVLLIKNEQNLGFAQANNQGLTIAKGRYFMLLNSDTIMCSGTVDALIETADAHPDVGVIGPTLLNADHTIQKSWASFPSFLSEVLGKNFRVRRPVTNLSQVYEVDWIMGACMLVRSEAVQDVGMMDPDYFFIPKRWIGVIVSREKTGRFGCSRALKSTISGVAARAGGALHSWFTCTVESFVSLKNSMVTSPPPS